MVAVGEHETPSHRKSVVTVVNVVTLFLPIVFIGFFDLPWCNHIDLQKWLPWLHGSGLGCPALPDAWKSSQRRE